MSWECGVCRVAEGRDEGVRIRGVCHHCGVPLCGDHCLVLGDPVFDGSPACHCDLCAERHHSGAAVRPARAGGAL